MREHNPHPYIIVSPIPYYNPNIIPYCNVVASIVFSMIPFFDPNIFACSLLTLNLLSLSLSLSLSIYIYILFYILPCFGLTLKVQGGITSRHTAVRQLGRSRGCAGFGAQAWAFRV